MNSRNAQHRIMFVDAHADDMQGAEGGLCAKLHASLGFVGLETTLTDGTVGHYAPEYLKHPDRLRELRRGEAQAAARVLGFDHQLGRDPESGADKDLVPGRHSQLRVGGTEDSLPGRQSVTARPIRTPAA